MAEEDEDFKTQIELEALEKQKQEQKETDPYTYTDPNDGSVYEWDAQKQAWFPKIDSDFIAKYQSNYQYQETADPTVESTSNVSSTAEDEQMKKGEKRKANDPCWFQVDDAHNTNVYVTGLPLDTNEEEFIELMSKCGLVMKDPESMKYKIKLYKNADGSFKGDARCCYIKIESVGLALDILDGYNFKGKEIHVERAQFQLKGQYDPSKKPKRKKKDKEKLKKKLEKLFDWRPDKLRGERSRNENTVIIKNMFDPKEFEEDATLILEYQKDVREECSKCGNVKKVVVYDRNPEGVVAVTFAEPEMADACINLMNGRYFAGRQLSAVTWDGKTKYKIIETEEEKQKRLKEWENFLQQGERQEPVSVMDQQTLTQTDQNRTYTDRSDSQVVPENTYELAGETDSSGESASEEGDQEVTNSDRPPVMNSSGSFSFSIQQSGSSDS